MPEKNIDSQIRKNGFIKGLLLGFIILMLSICSYYFIIDIAKEPWEDLLGPYIFSMIIPLLLIVFFALDIRKKLGGWWSFKQAVTGTFIMIFTSYVILTIGRDFIFAKAIEPNMIQKLETAMLNSSTSMYKKQGLSQAQINSQIAERKQGFEGQKDVSTGIIIQNFIINTMLLFVLAIILGALFKRERRQPIANE